MAVPEWHPKVRNALEHKLGGVVVSEPQAASKSEIHLFRVAHPLGKTLAMLETVQAAVKPFGLKARVLPKTVEAGSAYVEVADSAAVLRRAVTSFTRRINGIPELEGTKLVINASELHPVKGAQIQVMSATSSFTETQLTAIREAFKNFGDKHGIEVNSRAPTEGGKTLPFNLTLGVHWG